MKASEPSASAPRRAAWQGGWYRAARALPSPNHGPRPAGSEVDLIVVHSISLPPGKYGGDQVQALFTNTLDWDAHPYFQPLRGLQVSAHFYVRRDGRLWQFVSCDARAWHAGVSCFRGRENCNDYSVGIELEGLEDHPFEAAQYARLSTLLRTLAQRYPIHQVAGHEHIAPGRKRDPGSAFDWRQLQILTTWPDQVFPWGQTQA